MWSAIWIGLALAFNAAVYVWQGPEVGLQFLTGYLIEKSLSVDNIFVFVLLFSPASPVPCVSSTVCCLGSRAIVSRGTMIASVVALFCASPGSVMLGVFLLTRHQDARPERKGSAASREEPVRAPGLESSRCDGLRRLHFFVRRAGKTLATPLLLVLLVVESTDIIFVWLIPPSPVTTDAFIAHVEHPAILGLHRSTSSSRAYGQVPLPRPPRDPHLRGRKVTRAWVHLSLTSRSPSSWASWAGDRRLVHRQPARAASASPRPESAPR